MKKTPFYLLIPLVFIAFVLWIIPVGKIFEFDSDEGINIMKSLLYSEGFILYKDIWSDQPPLFTFILAWWLKIWGESILAVRFLVLLFSSLLISCFYQILRLHLGIIPAIAGVLILVNSHYYVQLSVSAMIGIPCLAIAILAIYFLTLGQYRYKQGYGKQANTSYQLLLLFSGISLALSLQIKLFSIFLIPLLALQILELNLGNLRSHFTYLVKWLITIITTYLIIGILFNSLKFDQLLQSHINSRQTEALFDSNYYTFKRLFEHMFGQDYLFYVLALLGIVIIIATKKRDGLFPLAWLGTVCLLLANHKPVWYHYYPLISIPMAWLAAYAISAMLNFFKRWHSGKLNHTNNQLFPFYPVIRAVAIFFIVILSIVATGLEMYRFRNDRADIRRNLVSADHREQLAVVNLINQYKDQTQWIFADKAIYPFYAGLKVPPEIAVLSLKRVLTGKLTYDQMLEIMQTYQPEQIVLSKFKDSMASHPRAGKYLTTHYIKIYENEAIGIDYYLLKELVR